MVRLNEAIKILNEINEKYHQYNIGHFILCEYNIWVKECDIQEDKYLIDFKNKVIYLK